MFLKGLKFPIRNMVYINYIFITNNLKGIGMTVKHTKERCFRPYELCLFGVYSLV